jgi:hypothetical protein
MRTPLAALSFGLAAALLTAGLLWLAGVPVEAGAAGCVAAGVLGAVVGAVGLGAEK